MKMMWEARAIEDEFIQESSECPKEHENLMITRIQISVEVLDPLLFLFPSIHTYVFPHRIGVRECGVIGFGVWLDWESGSSQYFLKFMKYGI